MAAPTAPGALRCCYALSLTLTLTLSLSLTLTLTLTGARRSALLMRSSADNGSSWSTVRTTALLTLTLKTKPTPDQVRTLHNYSGVVSGYVAPTVDYRSGAVLLFFNVNYTQAFRHAIRNPGRSPSTRPKPNPSQNTNPATQTWSRRSTDNGASWTAAINRTDAMGPLALGAGVQLVRVRVRVS